MALIKNRNRQNEELAAEEVNEVKDLQLRKLQGFMSSPVMLCCTTFFTVLCLFGEDVRIYFFKKPADNLFNYLFAVCLIYFIVEFALFCITQDGYRWGFFFWMDLVATVSLTLDMKWITRAFDRWHLDWLQEGQQKSALLDSRTTGVIGMVRLIRLIRLMKLYRMTTARSETDQEDRLREEARAALNAKQAALKRVEASRLGKQLSDMVTRIVILGVLLVVICLPLIRTTVLVDNSRWLGLRNLYRLGMNVCGLGGGVAQPCLTEKNAEIAWKWAVLRYAGIYRSTPNFKLLWLHIPSLPEGGKLRDIAAVAVEVDGQNLEWTATPECAGVSNPGCPWREEEQDLVTYEAEGLRTYAKFLVRDQKKQEAALSMLLTLFVISVLCILTYVFARDTQNLIVAPIEKMVTIVKQLADDPLHPPGIGRSEEATDKQKKKTELETSMLESTILKIGGLLQVGFGEAGANVISRNMKSGDGDLNIMIPGEKVQAIFGFCNIRQFTELTECLQEDVMAFINTVGGILHHCCHFWSGSASQNVGDTFLFTWKLGHRFDLDKLKNSAPLYPALCQRNRSLVEVVWQWQDTHDAIESGEMANKALVAFAKSIMEIRRNAELITFERDPRLSSRFGLNYHVKVSYGLHVGWAVEGAIGSDYKIDASYLSPHVTLTQKIQEATRFYSTPLLLSDAFYCLLSMKAKTRIRKVDVVKADGHQTHTLGLYCFDVNEGVSVLRDSDNRLVGDVIKPEDVLEIPVDHLRGAGVEYMFVVDADMTASHSGFPEQFYLEYRAAFCRYVEGNWIKAAEKFRKCLELVPSDGPSKALLSYMEGFDCKAPEGWRGYRVIPALKVS